MRKNLLAVLLICMICYAYSQSNCTISPNQVSVIQKEFTLSSFTGGTYAIHGIKVGPTSGDYYMVVGDGTARRAFLRYRTSSNTYNYTLIHATLNAPASQLLLTENESEMYSTSSNGTLGVYIANGDDGTPNGNALTNGASPVGETQTKMSLSPSGNIIWSTGLIDSQLSVVKIATAGTTYEGYKITDVENSTDHVSLASISDSQLFITYRNNGMPQKIVSRSIGFTNPTPTINWSKEVD